MPTPRKDESQQDFHSRCMSELVGDEGYDQDQANAICYSKWEDRNKKEQTMSSIDRKIDRLIEKGYTENQIVETLTTKNKPRVTEGIGSFLKTLRGKAAVKALSKMIELSGGDPTSEEEVYNFLKKNAPKESDDGHRLGAKVMAYMASGVSYEEATARAKEEMGQNED